MRHVPYAATKITFILYLTLVFGYDTLQGANYAPDEKLGRSAVLQLDYALLINRCFAGLRDNYSAKTMESILLHL